MGVMEWALTCVMDVVSTPWSLEARLTAWLRVRMAAFQAIICTAQLVIGM
jgi:hypothetical protein